MITWYAQPERAEVTIRGQRYRIEIVLSRKQYANTEKRPILGLNQTAEWRIHAVNLYGGYPAAQGISRVDLQDRDPLAYARLAVMAWIEAKEAEVAKKKDPAKP